MWWCNLKIKASWHSMTYDHERIHFYGTHIKALFIFLQAASAIQTAAMFFPWTPAYMITQVVQPAGISARGTLLIPELDVSGTFGSFRCEVRRIIRSSTALHVTLCCVMTGTTTETAYLVDLHTMRKWLIVPQRHEACVRECARKCLSASGLMGAEGEG